MKHKLINIKFFYNVIFLLCISNYFSFGQNNCDSLLPIFKEAIHNESKENEIIKISDNKIIY